MLVNMRGKPRSTSLPLVHFVDRAGSFLRWRADGSRIEFSTPCNAPIVDVVALVAMPAALLGPPEPLLRL